VPTRYLGSDAAPVAGAGTSWPAGEAPA